MLSSRFRFGRGACIALGLVFASLGFAQPALEIDDAHAQFKTWQPPAVTGDLAKIEGNVVVQFVVDASGAVTETTIESTTDARLDDVAMASVRQWTFEPAIRDRQPVASAMRVAVIFPLDQRARESFIPPSEPQPLPFVSPEVKRYGRTDEPEIIARRMLGGEVTLEFTVDATGQAADPRVLGANCPELIRPAIDALMRTEFAPARQGRLAVPAKTRAPFSFTLFGETRVERLAANGIRPADADDWSAFDVLPIPVAYADPVYPREALVAGQEGEAEVTFTVTRGGAVRDVTVHAATAPEFGAALAAVLPHWHFTAANVDGEGWVESHLIMKHRFIPPAPATDSDRAESRLAAALAPGGPGIGSAKGLDARIRPLFRIDVIAPVDLAEPTASAQIEFIIDRDGRARLPQVRETSSDAFGWAAATAVAQWVFERPTRGGEPVDVRVVVPIAFEK